MNLEVLALRDIKANYFKQMVAIPNINVFIRDLRDMVNDPQGKEDWQRHPEDFELYHLFTWDTENGAIEQEHVKQLLALSTLKAN